ncbi:hypothetical protein [Lysobacter sp. CA199]|uniref:hypothetical protein n=1 Tax=Lysobacter sp. CA199 TaxID=3455608 RepID=UPI003F8D7951
MAARIAACAHGLACAGGMQANTQQRPSASEPGIDTCAHGPHGANAEPGRFIVATRHPAAHRNAAMPYTLTPAGNALAIAEYQWAAAATVSSDSNHIRPTVQFTGSPSCIGIAARNNNGADVIGIHLAIDAADGTRFGVGDVATVTKVLQGWNYDPLTALVIGQIPTWKGTIPTAFDQLIAALGNPRQLAYSDGVYGAGVNDINLLVPTF